MHLHYNPQDQIDKIFYQQVEDAVERLQSRFDHGVKCNVACYSGSGRRCNLPVPPDKEGIMRSRSCHSCPLDVGPNPGDSQAKYAFLCTYPSVLSFLDFAGGEAAPDSQPRMWFIFSSKEISILENDMAQSSDYCAVIISPERDGILELILPDLKESFWLSNVIEAALSAMMKVESEKGTVRQGLSKARDAITAAFGEAERELAKDPLMASFLTLWRQMVRYVGAI